MGQRRLKRLFLLGRALGNVGQTQDACVTLAEVGVRFPGNPNVAEAQAECDGCFGLISDRTHGLY